MYYKIWHNEGELFYDTEDENSFNFAMNELTKLMISNPSGEIYIDPQPRLTINQFYEKKFNGWQRPERIQRSDAIRSNRPQFDEIEETRSENW